MKKLIALALFAISALTVSAQSVQIIEKNGIKDTDVAAAIADYPYVSADDLKDIVAEINDKVGKKELDREGALAALDEAATTLEKKAGDTNLDGFVDSLDVEDLFADILLGGNGFDFNGDGYIDSLDVEDLFNKILLGM